MARKDVDLVIRAKDEAAKVVDTITKALNEFVEAQSTLDAKANKTETALGKLGGALNGLDKAIANLDLGNGLAADVSKAGAAIERMDGQVAGARSEVAKLSQELSRSEAVAERYAGKMRGAAEALEKQKAAVSKAKVEQRELTAAYGASVAAQEKIAARQAQLPSLIAKQTESVAKSEGRFRSLAVALEGVEKPSTTMVKSFEAAGRAVSEKRVKLEALQAEYGQLAGKLRAAESAVALFGGQATSAADALARQENVLGKITQNYSELGQKSKAAVGQQRDLDNALDKATDGLNRQTNTLERAQGTYDGLVQSAKAFNAALSGSTASAKGGLESQLVSQGIAATKAREEYQRLEAAARELKAQIGAVGVPTREMAQALSAAAQRADEAQMSFLLQEETLQRMGRAYAEVKDDLNSISQGQQRFIAEQNRLSQAMKETADEGFRQRQALRALKTEGDSADGTMRKLSQSTKEAAAAADKNARATSDAARAYRQVLGDTRQSLGLTQRLRGEVLSLVAAYGGLYGVINLLGQVVEAYQVLEAAQARLNVANTGNVAETAKDLDFLRRTANTLGVEFGALAQEYSKFAIATQGTALEGEKTKKIFLSVAQAARVNRTSAAEMSGVFVALTQIVSKGAVQMEELRQQLGDRLPGALQIMADGLGVTTAQLIKMMEQGEVTAEALVPFAEELDRRFGPGLSEALKGTTVALGQMKNAAFQALLTFGEAGFMQAFTDLLRDMTATIQSADFQTFLESLSGGFATLADAIGFVARNFQFFLTVAAGLTALKLSPILVGLITSFGKWKLAMAGAAATSTAVSAAMASTGVAATGAAGGVTLLSRALTLLRANPIGLIFTAAAAAFTYWSSEASQASEALIAHRELVDTVKSAYEDAGGSVEGWRKKVEGLTVTDAKRNLDELNAALEESKFKLSAAYFNDGESTFAKVIGLGYLTGASQDYNRAIEDIRTKWNSGKMTAKELVAEIDKINQKFDDGTEGNKRYGRELIDAAKQMVKVQEAIDEAEKVLAAMTGTAEEAGDALDDLTGKSDTAASSVRDNFGKAMEALEKSVANLQEMAPKTKQGIDGVAAGAEELAKNYEDALAAARALPEAIQRAAAEQDALNTKAAGMKALYDSNQGVIDAGFGGSLVDRIIGVESGGNASAKNPNSSATGLGQFISSTWLRMFKQYFPDRAAGMSDAMILAMRTDAEMSRRMVELYLRENAQHLQKAGVAITDANLYLSHFLGPGGAVKLLNSAPGTLANNVLSPGQVSANASVLDGETRERVIAWAQRKVGISKEELSIEERMQAVDAERAKTVQKAAEDALKRVEEQKSDTKDRLADGEFEVSQQELINQGKERQAAIEKAIADAKKENPNITQTEIDKITEQTARLFDLEQQQKNNLTTMEKAQKAEQEVNNLLSQRSALVDQIEAAQKSGDTELTESLRAKIAEVNAQLIAAIENAKAMWGAVGGTEGDAALAKLEAARVSAQNFSFAAEKNYLDWSRVADLFVGGLSSAFDTFAQAVAEGESVGEAARNAFLQFAADFLREIAQMIIKQAIFNGLKSAFGGSPFGALIGLGHTGGVVGSQRVGSGNMSRKVDPSIFAGATRYHTGGIVGLRPNEVPIIAKKGEAMLTEDDPFHPKNRGGLGGGAPAAARQIKVVNMLSGGNMAEAIFGEEDGSEVVMNYFRANRKMFRQILGG